MNNDPEVCGVCRRFRLKRGDEPKLSLVQARIKKIDQQAQKEVKRVVKTLKDTMKAKLEEEEQLEMQQEALGLPPGIGDNGDPFQLALPSKKPENEKRRPAEAQYNFAEANK